MHLCQLQYLLVFLVLQGVHNAPLYLCTSKGETKRKKYCAKKGTGADKGAHFLSFKVCTYGAAKCREHCAKRVFFYTYSCALLSNFSSKTFAYACTVGTKKMQQHMQKKCTVRNALHLLCTSFASSMHA